ncbi:MAG: hypothetical protein J1E64_03710, partial [Acetatifactor sp.]|nr:hypothetical protein [Acetatifactor sp.]
EAEYIEEAEFYEEEAEYIEEAEFYEEEAEYIEEAEVYEDSGWGDEEVYAEDSAYKDEKKNWFVSIWHTFLDMSTMDRVITATGVAVLVLAIVTGGVYASASMIDRQMDEFVSVGSQLEGIDLIGDQGLVAMADEQRARIIAANMVTEEQTGYNEAEYGSEVTVALEMVSVLKDLKIKFVNKQNGKLIANVPFSVAVTDADGNSLTWTDDDMDGIIYYKDLKPGNFTVSLVALTDPKYAKYILPTAVQKVEVKKTIAYQKVDVANEVKKESEVNAAKEDTKKNETQVESSLNDTVTWVESTKSNATYEEVSKESISDPMTLVKSGTFLRVAGRTVEVEDVSGNEGGSGTTPPGTVQPTTPPVEPPDITLDKTSATVYTMEPVTLKVSLNKDTGNVVVNAVSSDTNIATVSVSGTTITVSGVKAGSATITVGYTMNGNATDKKATCAVTVKNNPKNDTNTGLKDKNGRQLYVPDGNSYREATYADYYTAQHFFISTGVKYTGWQTIDNKVYFFDSNGNKVTGEQVIQGAKYNFASDGSLVTGSGTMGIDVSKHNGSIDWNAVKNSGVSYVIIRCGYRGSTEGALIEDPKYVTNIKGATAAGLKVGVYFFTQAVNEVEAVEEASMVLNQISGYRISYPVFLDVESSGGRADKIDSATRTAVCKAFCATIKNAGYTSGIYANKTWLNTKLDPSALSAYKIWLAQYAATPSYTGRYDLWQYKSTGRISGISTDVDMNISYLGY